MDNDDVLRLVLRGEVLCLDTANRRGEKPGGERLGQDGVGETSDAGRASTGLLLQDVQGMRQSVVLEEMS